ncbi:hypothetical protein V6Z11_A10G277000 [Gossypium hirsutum]
MKMKPLPMHLDDIIEKLKVLKSRAKDGKKYKLFQSFKSSIPFFTIMAKASFVPSKSLFSSICITLCIHVNYMNTAFLHLEITETYFFTLFIVAMTSDVEFKCCLFIILVFFNHILLK